MSAEVSKSRSRARPALVVRVWSAWRPNGVELLFASRRPLPTPSHHVSRSRCLQLGAQGRSVAPVLRVRPRRGLLRLLLLPPPGQEPRGADQPPGRARQRRGREDDPGGRRLLQAQLLPQPGPAALHPRRGAPQREHLPVSSCSAR